LELRGRRDEALKLLKSKKLIRTELDGASKRREIGKALREIWSSTYQNRTVVLWISWAVLVYTYHGIFLWLPTIYVKELGLEIVKSLYWVLIITLIQVPGYYSATFLLDRVGRKPVLIAYLGIAGVGSYLLSFAKDATSIFVWSGLISFFNLGAWAGLYTYTPELYPTRIRGTGAGAAASIGRLAGIFAPTVTGFLYFSGGLPPTFTVFALAHFIAALSVAFLGIETKSKVLEDISR
jgi:putative MFS transporter